jgi:hypothetical protein
MSPQLHSGGSSLFFSRFKVKGNNDTPVQINFSVQVTGDLEAISPLHPISYASARADFSSLFYGDVSGLQIIGGGVDLETPYVLMENQI